MLVNNLLLISLASSAVAFGLRPQRMTKTGLKSVTSSPAVGATSTALFQSDSVDVVAAKEEPKSGFLSNIWNDQTQLFTYLTVWYLGNIYCKTLIAPISFIRTCTYARVSGVYQC